MRFFKLCKILFCANLNEPVYKVNTVESSWNGLQSNLCQAVVKDTRAFLLFIWPLDTGLCQGLLYVTQIVHFKIERSATAKEMIMLRSPVKSLRGKLCSLFAAFSRHKGGIHLWYLASRYVRKARDVIVYMWPHRWALYIKNFESPSGASIRIGGLDDV